MISMTALRDLLEKATKAPVDAPWLTKPKGNVNVAIVSGDFELATVHLRDWNPPSQGERDANAALIAHLRNKAEAYLALEEAARILYAENADYIRLNNLSGAMDNRSMVNMREALEGLAK